MDKGKERGILKLEPKTWERCELTPQGSYERVPSSPQPSVDRLSVTWDPSMTSGVNLFHLPEATPIAEVKFTAGDGSEDEDYSSISAVLRQRRCSVRRSRKGRRRTSSPFLPEESRSRRRSSVFTTSSGETAISMDDQGAVTQEEIFKNIRMHKEVLSSVKQQPLDLRRKLKLVHLAKRYIKCHEGQLQERLAQSKSTRDIYARFNILLAAKWHQLKREAANTSNLLIPWELRIKEIESHFGSVVASYFTFLRWLFWVNLVIGFILLVFVIVPEYLTANKNEDGERKRITDEEKKNATNLLTLWEFEGFLRVSPIFYGYYSSIERSQYRMPLAYFLTGVVVYIYAFVAILRKMAENSRMSKLSEKEDECIFSWKLFTGWDFMIGNTETAQNRTASVILGFKEALLEEAEKKKDVRNWRIIARRVFVNLAVLILLALSVFAVLEVVSSDTKKSGSWWHDNSTTIVVTFVSLVFPVFFELLGYMEKYHPRTQLRWQLFRIMLLNLLNLFSLIFGLFYKIQGMSKDLEYLKPNATINPNITAVNSTFDVNEIIFMTEEVNCSDVQACLSCDICVMPSAAAMMAVASTIAQNLRRDNKTHTKVDNIPLQPKTDLNNNTTLYTTNSISKTSTGSVLTENLLLDVPSSTSQWDLIVSLSKQTNESEEIVYDDDDYNIYDDATTESFTRTQSTEYSVINMQPTTGIVQENTDEISTRHASDVTDSRFNFDNSEIDWNFKDILDWDNKNDVSTTIQDDVTTYVTNGTVDMSSYETTASIDESTTDSKEMIASTTHSESDSTNIYTNTDIININTNILDKNTDKETETATTAYSSDDKTTAITTETTPITTETTQMTIETTPMTSETTTELAPSKSTEAVSYCPFYMVNCTTICGETNVTQVIIVSNCRVAAAKCYITRRISIKNLNLKNETLGANMTNSSEVDIVYFKNNLKMYNLTTETRSKLTKLCWETMLGQEMVKLTMMDLVFLLLGTLFMDFFRALFVRYMNRCWCWDLEKSFPEYGDFKIAENILHLINNQGQVWMGMFFSPGLVLLNVFKLMIMMYLRSWAVMTCNVPHEVVFRVSKSNNFYLGLLLTMLFLCVLPVGYSIVWVRPSWHCGPFSEYGKIYEIVTKNLSKLLPPSLNFAVKYIASPAIVIPLLVLLILIIYYLISLTNSLREANNDLKIQLRRERTEERRKMFQLADTRRKGTAMDNTPFARWKKALPGFPLGKSIDSDDRKTVTEDDGKAPIKPLKKKGNIFAKIVGQAVDKKSDLSEIDNDPSISPNNDDETDTDFHETLPRDVLKAKDITIVKSDKKIVEFKTQASDENKLKVKVDKEDRTDKAAVEKRNNETKSRFVTTQVDEVNEKTSKKDALERKQSEVSVIPVITISTTESDEDLKREYKKSGDSSKKQQDLRSLRRQSSVDSVKEKTEKKKPEDGHKYQYSL
ncbi:transmembrane channel-like protein [Cydia splendana]|uniref:transmembrane channel-like protein n=1 Tax=Cydia splendana TaxID=1100963 RepID=UPI00300C2FE2